jgi:SAM-dependent methyltransferase
MSWLTPARRRGTEILDDPGADPALSLRSLRDVALANRLFGGRRAVVGEVARLMNAWPTDRPLSLLDVGTGIGDIPGAVTRAAERRQIASRTIGLELSPAIAKAAGARCTHALAGDAMRLPFADASIDVVTCSQVLHHFDGGDADRLLQECTRVARTAVIIGDLRRSWLAVAGLWSSSFLLGFHPVSRHDGVVSILRGYTRTELATLIARATGCPVMTRGGLGFRVIAVWQPHASAMRAGASSASIVRDD